MSMTSSSSMIQVVKDGGIEQFEKPMPSHYWLRNKKQSIHYIHDTPFATDRQLEDQRLLMIKNRNPQYLVPTKVDKVRSQVISSTIGSSRPEAVKANVLNKIVREASGIHNYTIVAPFKTVDKKPVIGKLEPETNPRVRPYAKEAKMKPVLCSFGHRPRSASRTFHPATMKFRLKHGEIARGGDNVNKTGFGLPVSVLSQVLHAPKLYHPGDNALFGDTSIDNNEEFNHFINTQEQEEDAEDSAAAILEKGDNLNDLFFTESEHRKMFKPINTKQQRQPNKSNEKQKISTKSASQTTQGRLEDVGSLERSSWVSSTDHLPTGAGTGAGGSTYYTDSGAPGSAVSKPPAIVYPPLEEVYDDGRPKWDEAHHRIRLPSNHLFQLRASGLKNDGQKMSLGDRLHRFSKLSVAEKQPVLFCTEKQELDHKLMAGEEYKITKTTLLNSSSNNQPVYIDPHSNELKIIKFYRKNDLKKRNEKLKAKEYQNLLKTIPKVDYFPTTRLAEMYKQSGILSNNYDNSSSIDNNSSITYNNNDVNKEIEENLLNNNSCNNTTTNTINSNSIYNSSVYSSILQSDLSWQNTENDMKNAMKAAKAGDTQALYEFNMRNSISMKLPPLDPPTVSIEDSY